MWGVRSLCPKGQRRGRGTGRSHGPASSEEPLLRSWPLSRIPSPPSWKQQPLLPPEDVAAPSSCEPAWMGAFHILQSPFLLLDKKALFLPSLSPCLDWIFWEKSSDLVPACGHKEGWRTRNTEKEWLSLRGRGTRGDRAIKLVGLEKDTRMILKRFSECRHTKLNLLHHTVDAIVIILNYIR